MLVPIIGKSIFLFDLYFIFLVFSIFARTANKSSTINFNKKSIIAVVLFFIILVIPCFVYFNLEVLLFVIRKIQILLLFFILLNNSNYENEKKSFILSALLIFIINLVILLFQKYSYVYFTSLKLLVNTAESGLYNDSTEFGPIFLLYLTFITILLIKKHLSINMLSIFLILILTIGVILINSRTSLILLPYPLFILFFKFRKKMYILIPVIVFFLLFFLQPLLTISAKNSKFIFEIFDNGFYSIFETDTFLLRTINWNSLIKYFNNECSVFFGCGYTIEKSLEKLLISDLGVFSIDNTFVRLVFSSGYLGLLYYLYLCFILLKRSNLLLLLPIIFLLSFTQEVIQSLPIIVNLILIGILNFKVTKSPPLTNFI